MYKKKTTIQNPTGLHARPASDFIREAKKFSAKITVKRLDDGAEGNAKSIVLLLSLGIEKGTEIEICADGADERQAVGALVALVESGFGEQ